MCQPKEDQGEVECLSLPNDLMRGGEQRGLEATTRYSFSTASLDRNRLNHLLETETNRNGEFHVYADDETAKEWLLSDRLIQFSGG